MSFKINFLKNYLSRRSRRLYYFIERFTAVHDEVGSEVEDVDRFLQFTVEDIHGLGRHQHVARVVGIRQLQIIVKNSQL